MHHAQRDPALWRGGHRQMFARQVQVLAIDGQVGVVTQDAGGQRSDHQFGIARGFEHGLIVHRIGHGLAHVDVGHRPVFGVHLDREGAVFRFDHAHHAGGVFQRVHVLAGQVHGDMHLAALQHQPLGRGFAHDLPDHAIQVAAVRLPGGLGPLQVIERAGLGPADGERTRARDVRLKPGGTVVAAGVRFGLGLRDDEDPRNDLQEGRKGAGQFEAHGPGVGGGDRVGIDDAADHPAVAPRQPERPLIREDHVLGGDRRTVVEHRVGVQRKGIGLAVAADLPALCQGRNGLWRVAGDADQRVIGVAQEEAGGIAGRGVRIEVRDILPRGNHQDVAARLGEHLFRKGRGGQAGARQRQEAPAREGFQVDRGHSGLHVG